MYLQRQPSYYRGTAQCQPRGLFLILLSLKSEPVGFPNLYAVVRKVALAQCGHWMMGRANLGGRWVALSGAYGNDGLPKDIDKLPADAVPVPRDLYDQWNTGGGHNGPGSEARELGKWALDKFITRE